LLKDLARARNRVPLPVDQALDLKHHLYVAAAVKALPRSALVGLKLRELRLPETKHVGFKSADPRDVSDLEIQAVRDCG